MAIIHLKNYPPRFQEIKSGLRTSDIRANDRDFKVGDTIILWEGQMEGGEFIKTGDSLSRQITLLDTFGVSPGFINIFWKAID